MSDENSQRTKTKASSIPRADSALVAAAATYEFEQTVSPSNQVQVDCVVVGITDCALSPSASAIDQTSNGYLSKFVEGGLGKYELGATTVMPIDTLDGVAIVLLVGTGSSPTISPSEFKRVVTAVHEALGALRLESAALYLTELAVTDRDDSWKIQQQVIGCEDAAYSYRTAAVLDANPRLSKIYVSTPSDSTLAVREGRAIAEGVRTTRALGDMPPNLCTPSFLADFATSLSSRFETVTTSILGTEEMTKLGMNAILSVGHGSAQPSKFIEMRYQHPDAQTDAPIVLVGKGVTFDTGGTALKTRDSMSRMKYDMCGAATVIAVIKSIAELELPLNVVGLCACAENMPGAKATRPSDTVRSMSGLTVEILNPDAEGRLLLCDALTYAERLNPQVVIDLATLTGASLIALGRHYSALFTEDPELLSELQNAGERTMDKVWQLPLPEEDLPQLDSQFADLANIGDGSAGCVVAALFLSQFAQAYPWAHLDVSSTAKSGGEHVMATGRPTPLILEFLFGRARSRQTAIRTVIPAMHNDRPN